MIDLENFIVKKDETRPYLLTPFSRGEFSYATDGRCYVRVPRVEGIREQDKINGKDGEVTWNRPVDGVEEEFRPIVLIIPPPVVSDVECDACDGRGVEHDCPDCECTCGYCGGSGKASEKLSVTIAGMVFNAKYLRPFIGLPELKAALVKQTGGDCRIVFRFDGGVGSVAAMRGAFSNNINNLSFA